MMLQIVEKLSILLNDFLKLTVNEVSNLKECFDEFCCESLRWVTGYQVTFRASGSLMGGMTWLLGSTSILEGVFFFFEKVIVLKKKTLLYCNKKATGQAPKSKRTQAPSQSKPAKLQAKHANRKSRKRGTLLGKTVRFSKEFSPFSLLRKGTHLEQLDCLVRKKGAMPTDFHFLKIWDLNIYFMCFFCPSLEGGQWDGG